MPKKLGYLLIVTFGCLIALYYYNKYRIAPTIKFNELGLVNSEGQPFDFNSLKGKKLIVSMYASWCGNCLTELQAINRVKNAELNDVEIICVTDESLEKLVAFKEKKGYPFTFLKMKKKFPDIGINSIPVVYILNKNLQVVKEQVGYLKWDDAATLNYIKSLF
jgi:thiol-disulfide isomerase/thioredoxin